MPRSTPPPEWVLAERRRIGDRIRAARLYANLTQEAVANRIEMDRPSYNRVEQGHSSPLLDTLILVADAIGVPLAELLAEDAPARPRRGTQEDRGSTRGT